MNTNSRVVLNGDFSRKEHGSLEYARNIQLSDDYKSAENEDGFDEIFKLVYNNVSSIKPLGHLLIDDALILFANAVIESIKYFCVIEYNDISQTQKIILQTVKINVSDENYISSSYTFNHKKERIVTWSDGLTSTSNKPFSINIDTRDYINPLSNELIGDVTDIHAFVNVVPLDYTVNVIDGGNIKGGAYFITTRLYYTDDVITPWDIVRGPYYIHGETGLQYNKALDIKLSGVDVDAKSVELAVIRKSEGVVVSKIKGKYIVNSNSNGNVNLSVANDEGQDIDLTDLLVKASNFTKLGVLAKVNNKQYVGGVEEEDSFINYQKYANKIVTSWKILSNVEVAKNELSFQEGEVYAFDIALILNSGALTPPFHIPGRTSFDANEITNSNNPESDYYYHAGNNVNNIISKANDTLTLADFDTIIDLPITHRIKVILLNEEDDTELCNILYANVVTFNSLSSSLAITKLSTLDVTTGNGKIFIESNTSSQSIDNNIKYKVKIECNTLDNATYVDITNNFKLKDKVFEINGGFTKAIANQSVHTTLGVNGIGQMSYWENKDEYYPNDDTVVYPNGKVRHHRFPLMKELGMINNTQYQYDKIRFAPVFDNIIIPDDIKHLVKGYVITYIRKDVYDKLVFVSTIKPTYVYNNAEPNQSIVYNRTTTSYYNGYIYNKLVNADLLNAKVNNLITHLIPLGTEPVEYKIISPWSNKKSGSLGFESVKDNYREMANLNSYLYIGQNDAATTINAIPIIDQQYVEAGAESSKKLTESSILFNNTAACEFLLIRCKLLNEYLNDDGKNSYEFAKAIAPTYITDVGINDHSMITGSRYPEEVKQDYLLDVRYYIETNVVPFKSLIPYTYAYSKKNNVHFGFNNNHDRVIAKIIIDITLSNVVTDKGDIVKSKTSTIETMFPLRPAIAANYDEDWAGNVTGYDVPTFDRKVFNTRDMFLDNLSKFNAGEESKLSYSIDEITISGIINPKHYYTKGDKDKIIANDGHVKKVPTLNPLANHKGYYDKDNHALNTYGAPIADPLYKSKTSDAFNAIVWSDTANDVRTSISNLKTFRSSNRYYMPIEDGNVIQLISKGNALFIQQEDNLSLAIVKDTLDSEGSQIYTGSGDIFDRPPKPILNTIGEVIRCTHPLHCQDTMIGICIIDNFNKAIYVVNGDKVDAISHVDCDSFFKNNLTSGYKNPFIGKGWQIASNNLKNTIYITSLDPLNKWTFSFNPIIKGWHSFHDYNSMYMINAGSKFYSINQGYLYKHAKSNKGLFYRNGQFRVKHQSFLDIVCSDQLDITKIFESIIFETNYFDVTANSKRYDKSVDGLLVYNDSQCSVVKDITLYHESDTNNWFTINKRNVGNAWVVNDFRDNVININEPFLNKDKELIPQNLSTDKDWFNNSLITSNACVIRLIMNNETNDIVQINNISVYARKSNV